MTLANSALIRSRHLVTTNSPSTRLADLAHGPHQSEASTHPPYNSHDLTNTLRTPHLISNGFYGSQKGSALARMDLVMMLKDWADRSRLDWHAEQSAWDTVHYRPASLGVGWHAYRRQHHHQHHCVIQACTDDIKIV